ncbi:MAG: hypothetical protein WCX48_10680 [Bacteroidales bacterium]|jgi:hypothetical protein
MDYKDEDDRDEDDLLEDCPGILIPCGSIEDLQKLVYLLFDKSILESGNTFCLKNVPKNMNEILNTPEYFEETEVFGFRLLKGRLKDLEKPTKDLL